MKRVIVHIDDLVLKGFRHEDRHAIAEGVRAELGRQFAQPELLQAVISRGGISRLKVDAVKFGTADQPAEIGSAAARGIAKEMGR